VRLYLHFPGPTADERPAVHWRSKISQRYTRSKNSYGVHHNVALTMLFRSWEVEGYGKAERGPKERTWHPHYSVASVARMEKGIVVDGS